MNVPGAEPAEDSATHGGSRAGAAADAAVAQDGAAGAAVESGRVGTLPAGGLSRQMIWLAAPMLGEQCLNMLVGFVDTVLAGTISKEATTAVGAASYMNWIVMLAFSLVGVGAAAIVGRALGARDHTTARRTLHQAMLLAAAMGFAVCTATFLLAPTFAAYLTRTPAAFEPTVAYTRIVAFAYLLGSFNLVGSGLLRIAGDTRTPLMVMSVVNVLNVVISWALVTGVGGLSLGVEGIAIGTLAARSAGGLLMLGVLLRGRGALKLRFPELRLHGPTMSRVLRLGLPAAMDTGMMSIAQLLFIRIIADSGAQDAATVNFAAHIIGVEVEALSYLPAFAWGTATATLVSQYLGAGRPELALRAARLALIHGAILGAATGAIYALFAGPIYGVMTRDPAVIAVGVPAFRLLGAAQPFLCMAIVATTALRGAGDTRTTMWYSLIGGLLLRVPVAYIGAVVLGGGLIGAWCGMWADNIAKCALTTTRVIGGRWRGVRV